MTQENTAAATSSKDESAQTQLSDAVLVRLYREYGAEFAFGILASRYEVPVRQALRALGVGVADIDSEALRLFVSAGQQLHRLDDPNGFASWIMRLACTRHGARTVIPTR